MFRKTTLSVAALAVAFIAFQPVSGASAAGPYVNPYPYHPVITAEPLADEPVFTGPLVSDTPVTPILPVLPNPISCKAAKNLVKNAGYKKVKTIECNGGIYTFKAKKNGQKMVVAVNAITKQIWAV